MYAHLNLFRTGPMAVFLITCTRAPRTNMTLFCRTINDEKKRSFFLSRHLNKPSAVGRVVGREDAAREEAELKEGRDGLVLGHLR